MRAYSQDLRDRVISKYTTGKYMIIELSQMFNIDRHTTANWIMRYKDNGDYSSKQHIQTGKAIKFNDRNKVLEYLTTNQNSNGITIRNNVAPGLAISTFYDALARMQITYKKRADI